MEWRREIGFSPNKPFFLSLWRLCILVLYRSAGSSMMESPVMPPWWWCGSGEEIEEAFFNKRRVLPKAHHLRQPPPARGRSGESDGGPPSSDGHGEESMVTRYNCFFGSLHLRSGIVVTSEGGANWTSSYIRQLWSWEAILSSTTLAAGHRRPTSKASTKPIYMLVKESGKVSTSNGRPPSRLATASNAGAEASGVVPASELDGGLADLWLDGSERGGFDCTCRSFSRVLPTNAWDLCVTVLAYGVLCVIVHPPLIINEASRPFGATPC
jgi:hypothetical protein